MENTVTLKIRTAVIAQIMTIFLSIVASNMVAFQKPVEAIGVVERLARIETRLDSIVDDIKYLKSRGQ
jgi:hypothetical protein